MERRKVDILCVQETRWKGSKARSIGAGFKLFYYGVDSKRNGVGVVLKEEFVRNVLEVKRVSDRVMSLKLEIEGVMLNVVSGYAPQVGCELEEKERFWSELDEVMESIPTGERVVIGADFNGHVGEGNTGDEEVMGKFGVKERNLEGQMVVDFAKRMDMGVVNTYFQKREEHRVTYKSGGRRTQVVLPDDWETTAEVIRETGRKVLGVSSGRRKEDKETWWWDEEVQDSIQRKRLAKKKWDMDRTEENRQEYKELQRRVKREVSKAKQKAYEELYTRLDTREGEKDLYRLARQRDRDGKDVQQKVDKIRKDEVRKALKRMKSGKAVGPDDIPVEVWKCLGEAAVEFLANLFNRVLENLEKAYDRVPREELWYCMRKSGVAEKYVRVVQDMYERSRTVVRCAVVMDQLSEEVRQESPWTMMFADDIVICSESREQVEENLERWRFALERRGMKVSRIQSNGECGKEKISARIKGKVYRTVVRPAMLYGLETVSLRKRQESELEVAELKMLREARLRWFGHVQRRDKALYITCKLQNCTEANKGKPFPGYIDPNSLVVQDEYVFVQVSTGGRPIYYVSSRRDLFTPMKLPKYTLPKDLHVISTDENRVVAAVQEWNQNDTYNLYVSESRGVYYTLALENVMSSMGPEGNVMIELYEVAGIKGMFLANKKLDDQVKTYITYNKGRDWRLLQAPSTDLRGNSIHCILPYCSLHLQLHVSANPYTSGNIASKDSAPGIIVASGSIGAELNSNNVSIFITSDAGNTWRQGEPCLMGVKRIYRKLKPMAKCVMGKTQSVTVTSDPCECTESDFECDYGYERRTDGRCTPAFWFHPSSMSRSCITGHTFLNSTGYRKVVSNNCTGGVVDLYMARRRPCPSQAPKGLHLVTSEGKLTATLGHNVTFLVFLEQGDGSRTSITLDFGDGHAITYSNVSSIEDGIKHIYKSVGIYRVTATAENSLGFEMAVLFLHVTCE
ncbi:hypothetical protein QTP70_011873 [Hemibagrus guttatus]|uniref:PKD domain-containing protein n=1 Tax=Hemibagrus guttatus TaxID=175788 RepID=A0AAE0ULV9_9TELE|nr:hypothetical protein QTP70_011873 [Hemibagrus guttatus]